MVRIILLLCVLLMSGCASDVAHKQYADANEKLGIRYLQAAEKPLLSLTLPAPNGGEYKLQVARELKQPTVAQIKDSEWTAPVSSLINATGMVAGAAVVVGGAGHNSESVGGDKVGHTKEAPVTTITETTSIIGVAE